MPASSACACTCALSCDGDGVLRCPWEHFFNLGPTGENACDCEAGYECRRGGECPGCGVCREPIDDDGTELDNREG